MAARLAVLAALAAAAESQAPDCVPVIQNIGDFCDSNNKLSADDCAAAAATNGKLVIADYSGQPVNNAGWPSGCVFKNDGSVWYNTDSTNNQNNEMRAICCMTSLPNEQHMAQLPAGGDCNKPNNYIMVFTDVDCGKNVGRQQCSGFK